MRSYGELEQIAYTCRFASRCIKIVNVRRWIGVSKNSEILKSLMPRVMTLW